MDVLQYVYIPYWTNTPSVSPLRLQGKSIYKKPQQQQNKKKSRKKEEKCLVGLLFESCLSTSA